MYMCVCVCVYIIFFLYVQLKSLRTKIITSLRIKYVVIRVVWCAVLDFYCNKLVKLIINNKDKFESMIIFDILTKHV